MEIAEILNCFKDPKGRSPTEAVNAALQQQEAITPHLLTILEYTISNYERIDDNQVDYIFALYLLSKFREKRALPLILALAALPKQALEFLLGDIITEGLARFIVSTFDGDLAPIKKVVEDATLYEWSRYAALRSLVGLVALQKLQREELIDYLRSLFHSPLADDEDFVTHLVSTAADLYPEELMEEINQAFEQDKIDYFVIDKEWVDEILKNGKEQCLAVNVYNDSNHLPIEDIEKDIGWMGAFYSSDKDDEEDYDDYAFDDINWEIAEPYVREIPKIGRNEPCPCGSGKKYKKCCLE